MQTVNLKDPLPETDWRKILLLGRSGAGKTTFLRTMPQPLYVADFDAKGRQALAGHTEGRLDDFGGADAWAEFKAVLTGLEKECPYQTVSLDSLSLGADSIVTYAKAQNGNRSPRTTQEDWGRAITEVTEVLRRLKALPCHLMVSMHFQHEKDELLGSIMWQPAIFGRQLPGRLPGYFNDVWLLRVVTKTVDGKPTTERVLQLAADQRFDMLKNSGNGAWAAEEKPDFSLLINKLRR